MRLEIDGNAWNQGFWDGEMGLAPRSCPYARGTSDSLSWSSGYIEGKAARNGYKATLPCSPLPLRKDAPAAEAGAVPLRFTAPASAAEETKEKGVNFARRSGVKVPRRLTARGSERLVVGPRAAHRPTLASASPFDRAQAVAEAGGDHDDRLAAVDVGVLDVLPDGCVWSCHGVPGCEGWQPCVRRAVAGEAQLFGYS